MLELHVIFSLLCIATTIIGLTTILEKIENEYKLGMSIIDFIVSKYFLILALIMFLPIINISVAYAVTVKRMAVYNSVVKKSLSEFYKK